MTREFWLTRRSDGKSMLTLLKPTIERRYGSREAEVYITPGEPIAVQNLCENGVMALFGMLPEKLESVKVLLTGDVI